MENHSLIRMLRTFSRKELSEFEKFAASPYHNQGRNYVSFIRELKNFHPQFSHKHFTKKQIFSRLYSGKTYNAALMDTTISRTLKLAEKFLLYSSFDKAEFEKSTMLLREFSRRKLEKAYYKKLSETEKILESKSVFGTGFLEDKLILETIKTDYLIDRKDLYKFEGELAKRDEYVVLAFIRKLMLSLQDIYVLRYELNLRLTGNLPEETFGHIDMERILERIKASGSPYFFAIELKYKELLAMMNLDMGSYNAYKNLVLRNAGRFNWREKHQLFGMMTSICVMGIHKGVKEFNRELLEVSKKRLDENSYAYTPDEYTNIQGYFNMLTEFVENDEQEYFERLVVTFGSRLNPEYKESVINFSFMSKKFKEKKFDEALSYNPKIDHNHSLLKYAPRVLLMKIYYELNYTEELINLLDSSTKFFSSVMHYSEKNIQRYLNLIKYLKKLVILKDKKALEKLTELRKEISSRQDINSKEWLLEKIGLEISI